MRLVALQSTKDGWWRDVWREEGKEVRRKGWWEEAARGNNVHKSEYKMESEGWFVGSSRRMSILANGQKFFSRIS